MSGAYRRAWVVATAVSIAVVVIVLSGASAAASGVGTEPYQIQSASLTQDGQDFVWQVTLGQPWGSRRHASLCLQIERVATGAVWGEACLVGSGRRSSRPSGKRSSRPRLEYMAVSGGKVGPAQPVTATVTGTTRSEVTVAFLPAAVDLRYGPIRWQTISAARAHGCGGHGRTSAPTGRCSVRYPAKSMLLNAHTPVLVGCQAGGPSLVYDGSANDREIALTFDDGPWGDPPSIDFVRELAREHVPATFFEIGDQIATYDPGGVAERAMLAQGDMIGDHTWSHPNVAALRPRQQRTQLLRGAAAINRATGGFTPCLWRPPYGAISPSLTKLARSLGFLTIMWDVDPRDWATPGVGAIYSNVVRNAHDGAIVLQHFGGGPRAQTLAALPREIKTLRARGYRFVTVAQLLGLQLVYR